MTTNTPSQAESIDTREFRLLLADLCEASEFGPDEYAKARDPFIAHINAKLAEAREEGRREVVADAVAKQGQILQRMQDAERRAEKAESRLAEIQRGVAWLPRYAITYGRQEDIKQDSFGKYVLLDEVLALLAPRSQSGTSGLPS